MAVSVSLSPTVRLSEVLLSCTFGLSVTVMVHVLVFFPSLVLTVTSAVPAFLAVTLPEAVTVATPGLLDVNVTFLFDASEGDMEAFIVHVSPTVRVLLLGEIFTPATGTYTSTLHVFFLLPCVALHVMVTFPFAIAFTLHFLIPSFLIVAVNFLAETLAIFFLEEIHLRLLSVAFLGSTLAFNVKELPFLSSFFFVLSVILVIFITLLLEARVKLRWGLTATCLPLTFNPTKAAVFPSASESSACTSV